MYEKKFGPWDLKNKHPEYEQGDPYTVPDFGIDHDIKASLKHLKD